MQVFDALLIAAIVINTALFSVLAIWVIQAGRRTDSPLLRGCSNMLGLICSTVVVGATHRLGLQAHRLGWIDDDLGGVLLAEFQLAKSLVTAVLGLLALRTLMRMWTWLQESDRVITVLTGQAAARIRLRLSDIDVTDREEEVLAVIGSGRLRDPEIPAALHISPHTARTHVRNILRKTGLNDRRELVLIADLPDMEANPQG